MIAASHVLPPFRHEGSATCLSGCIMRSRNPQAARLPSQPHTVDWSPRLHGFVNNRLRAFY